MIKKRIIETNEGIQNELTVEIYNDFAKHMRDKEWHNVDKFIQFGINKGKILEIGPGPGYVGLEILKKSPLAKLTGIEISENMIKLATNNAKDYHLEERVKYVKGNCANLPFENDTFDGVFSNGSLHEWENPLKAINEIYRVLKPGCFFCITDMRRNSNLLLKWLIYISTKPKEIRPGFLSSYNASYIKEEIAEILKKSDVETYSVNNEVFGICISGKK
ncbi:MAG: class I SAM-dependent methyltransferase [Sphaerochaetaceae bacterium]